MIQANVCAAETLEQRRTPLIYRVHDTPSEEKLQALADFLATLASPGSRARRRAPTGSTACSADRAAARTPRSSTRWCCAPRCRRSIRTDNIGHFGLNLDRYAHFTSPIRRYADLIVHRALIRALGLGDDGLTDEDIAAAQGHRRAHHPGRAPRHGRRARRHRPLCRRLPGGPGRRGVRGPDHRRHPLWPLRAAGRDRRRRPGPGLQPGRRILHPRRAAHALVGERTGARWRLGREVEVRLREATPITGGLLFEMLSEPNHRSRPAVGPNRRTTVSAAARIGPLVGADAGRDMPVPRSSGAAECQLITVDHRRYGRRTLGRAQIPPRLNGVVSQA